MNKGTKRGCLWGCSGAALLLVAIAGTGTWYAARMTKDFKHVRDSEKILVEALADQPPYTGDLVNPPAPERLEAFLAIRRGMQEWRFNLEHALAGFKAPQEGESNNPWNFFKSLRAGTELTPVYAGFWQKRNALLLQQHMGPEEYTFLYQLVFYTWMGHDPHDGAATPTGTALVHGDDKKVQAVALTPPPALVWAGDPAALDQALSPFGHALAGTYSAVLNPLEFLFVQNP